MVTSVLHVTDDVLIVGRISALGMVGVGAGTLAVGDKDLPSADGSMS